MASGKHAFGICDRSGFRYKLSDLVWEISSGKRTGMRIGKDIVDKDHPQNFIGRVKTSDNMALSDGMPDTNRDEANALWGWNPVGNPAQTMTAMSGRVTITVT